MTYKLSNFTALLGELELRIWGLRPLTPAATAARSGKTPEKNQEEVGTKITPKEGDEGFEGPPCRQTLEKDVESLDKDAKKQKDVKTLGNKAESRAVQGTSARVLENSKKS